jgi:hypothetical protein
MDQQVKLVVPIMQQLYQQQKISKSAYKSTRLTNNIINEISNQL